MNFMNRSTRSNLVNTMYKFSGRSTTSALFLTPLKERGSLFIPNLRNPFFTCSPRFSTTIPSIGNRTDESREERTQSAFNFKAYMLEKLSSVNKALDAAVPLKEPIKIHEAMRYSLLSGSKRVCSIVCIASCELAGGTESIAMPAACSLEMIVTLSLMLDDLPSMDNSDFRRQKPSNHKVFGESMTLLAAVSLQALAFEHIAKAAKDISSPKILRVISELATLIGAEGVAGGQAADLELEGKSGIELEQVEYIHLHKAASFFEAAAVAGGILGGASEEEIKRLRKYSKYAGLLYQVVDDILDVTKSDQELGKPTGKDLVSDKATYPKLIGLEKSRKLAEKLVREAQAQLVGFDPEKAAPLKALVDFAYDRQK